MAVPFDPQRLTVTGAAVPVVEGVLQSPSTGAAQYSFSATGSLVYVPGGVQSAQSRLVWVNRNGAEQPLAAPAHAYLFPRLSPDGRRVAVAIEEQETQIWLYDLSRETLTRLTFEGSANIFPGLDTGRQADSVSIKQGRAAEHFLATGRRQWRAGAVDHQRVHQCSDSWSPDGQLLAFGEINPTTGYDIWVLRMGDPSVGLRAGPQGAAVPPNTVQRNGGHGFPPTGAGWPMSRTNRAAMRFTCSPIRAQAGSGKSRRKAARSRCGTPTGGSCSTAAATR